MKGIVIFIALLFVLYLTNPSLEEHQLAVKRSSIDLYNPPKNIEKLADIIAYGASTLTVTTDDYRLFSLTQIKGVTVGFGALTVVIIFDGKLKNVKNNSLN